MNAFALLLVLLPLKNENTANAMRPISLPLTTVGTPADMTSFMVSDDYAQIDWKAVPGADVYQIQIRKEDGRTQLILEEPTVWTSFYFRVAQSRARYSFRLKASVNGMDGEWTSWVRMKTQSYMSKTDY